MTNTHPSPHTSTRSAGFSAVIVVLLVAVVGALVAGGVWYSRRTPSESGRMMQTTPMMVASASPVGSPVVSTTSGSDLQGTFADMARLGRSVQCDWTPPAMAGTTISNGKMYASGGMVRSQAEGNVSGMMMETVMIYRDGTMYSWSKVGGQTPFGFKVTEAESQAMADRMTPEQKQQGEQFRQQYTFHCSPWTPDTTLFDVPTTIQFRSL